MLSVMLRACLAIVVALLLPQDTKAVTESSFPGVWPMPRAFTNGSSVVAISPDMKLKKLPDNNQLAAAFARFVSTTFRHDTAAPCPTNQQCLSLLTITVRNATAALELGVNESYTLAILADPASGIALEAETIFGAYRGLETLSQLIRFDMDAGSYQISHAPWRVDDEPRFPHRELLLDSARHFIPLARILRVLDSMSYAKLNTLHWHLSDSQAFPYIAPSHPEMAQHAAWSPAERYTQRDVSAVVRYAAALGIRVVVEIDTPGHTASWCKSHPEVCPALVGSCNPGNSALMPHTNRSFALIEAPQALKPYPEP